MIHFEQFSIEFSSATLVLPLAASGAPPRPKPEAKAPAQAINLNTATATELVQLPHIGPKTAERIVAFRKEHGPFQRLEDLMNVKGIGEKAFAQIRPFLQTPSSK